MDRPVGITYVRWEVYLLYNGLHLKLLDKTCNWSVEHMINLTRLTVTSSSLLTPVWYFLPLLDIFQCWRKKWFAALMFNFTPGKDLIIILTHLQTYVLQTVGLIPNQAFYQVDVTELLTLFLWKLRCLLLIFLPVTIPTLISRFHLFSPVL